MSTEMIINQKGKINIVLNEQRNRSNYSYQEHDKLKEIEHYFSSFIGLNHFKHILKEIYATKLINSKREEHGLSVHKQVLHMIFTGNPGTGKTTVARQLATVLYKLNILSKGHFIEAERADLVGEYIGQTAQKTRALVQKALGGVLFIDEAYALARGGQKDFGREAIDTLVKQMEDYHDDLVLILAGYPSEMEYFLQLNPGLKSRFPFHISFFDYTLEELMDIGEKIALEREYELSDKAKWKLRNYIREQLTHKPAHFSNARFVRNVIEQSIRKQATRLLHVNHYTHKDLMQIHAEDLQIN